MGALNFFAHRVNLFVFNIFTPRSWYASASKERHKLSNIIDCSAVYSNSHLLIEAESVNIPTFLRTN